MATSEFHFFEDTFSRLDVTLSTYVGDVASNVIGAVSPAVITLVTIYVVLWGLAMMRGMIQEPVVDGVMRIVKLSLITGIGLSLARYNQFVADFLWKTPDALAAVVVGSAASDTNVQFLDGLMSRVYDLGDAYWQKANASSGMSLLPDFGLLAVAMLVWIAGIAATGYAAFLLALSKMALAVLLGLGPIFIALLIFEGTKRFFEAWIGQALNYLFLVSLTAAAVRLILTILQGYLGAVSAAGATTDPGIDQALPAIVLCLIAALVMMQLPSIASALGGGVAISTLGAAGWSYGKAAGGIAALRPINVQKSLNRARSDVRIVAQAGRSFVSAPLSVMRRGGAGPRGRREGQ